MCLKLHLLLHFPCIFREKVSSSHFCLILKLSTRSKRKTVHSYITYLNLGICEYFKQYVVLCLTGRRLAPKCGIKGKYYAKWLYPSLSQQLKQMFSLADGVEKKKIIHLNWILYSWEENLRTPRQAKGNVTFLCVTCSQMIGQHIFYSYYKQNECFFWEWRVVAWHRKSFSGPKFNLFLMFSSVGRFTLWLDRQSKLKCLPLLSG